jgi:two-component system sensor histidine kinase RegB
VFPHERRHRSLAQPAPVLGQDQQPTGLNVRRLIWIRMIAVPGSALCLLLARRSTAANPGPAALMIVAAWSPSILGLAAPQSPARLDREFFIQLLVDLVALTSILYYAGGASNPFVYLLVLPMIISAAALPQTYTWIIAGLSAASYTLLMLWRVEVPGSSTCTASRPWTCTPPAWLGFVVLSVLIATVAAMAQTVRERDRYLARLRETALGRAGGGRGRWRPVRPRTQHRSRRWRWSPADREVSSGYPSCANRDSILRDQIARCKRRCR